MTEHTEPDSPIKVHGITITFNKPLELTMSPRAQYNYTRVILSKLLNISTFDFALVPEFTLAGRIHYHGILKIKNFAKWVKDTLPPLRRLGFIKLENKISIKWTQYIYKSLPDTRVILGLNENSSITIVVTKYDYKEWKDNQPLEIDDFDIKSKMFKIKRDIDRLVCQLPNDPNPIPTELIYDVEKDMQLYHHLLSD